LGGSTTKKVLIRRFDKDLLVGYVHPQSYLRPNGVELLTPDGTFAIIPYHEVKAVSFVRDFEALEAFSHLMKLTPLNAEVYSQISQVNMALRKPEAAIVARWQAFAVGKTEATEWALMFAYREAYPDDCAETQPRSLKPNLTCPLVKAHVCLAYDGLMRVLRDAGWSGEIQRYQQKALDDYGCTPGRSLTSGPPSRHMLIVL